MRVKVGFVALALIAVVAVSMGCSSSVQQTNENEVPATLAADQPTIVLPPGVSCLEVIENAGSISDLTHGGDLVAGWEFDIKHNLGFADHGCEIVSSRDGHPTRTGLYSLRFEVREGDCNANEGWDDCSTDRSRHELTQIPRNKDHQYEGDEYWYNWSILLPDKPLKTGNAISFVGQFNSDNAARFYMEDFSKGLGFRFNDETYKIIQQGVKLHFLWNP